MGRLVIVAYRPRPGRADELLALTRQHVPVLRELGFATERAPYLMRSEDGTLIEVFEWKSEEAIARAHEDPAIQAMWAQYAEVCEYVPLTGVVEAGNLFAEFEPVEL
jgi:quinol monooxygenase YgiN